MMLPKENIIRDEAHLRYIRSLPCVVCNAPPPSEAAHLRMGLGGGMALKPSDELTLPLCHMHHEKQHRVGEAPFWMARLACDRQLVVRVMRAFARSFKA